MNNLSTAISMVKKNYFMASVNLPDAYYYVPVATGHQQYLYSRHLHAQS